MGDNSVDIIITWVDSNDSEWNKSRIEWARKEGNITVSDNNDERFRDWDTVKYLFRGIDMFTPWVRKVHLITVGHLPAWINVDAPRLNIVKHEDFIPEEYLPTFSSHTIELNMHRIKGLSDKFIYFNDDMLMLKKMKEECFFRNNLPCDFAVLNALVSSHRYSVMDTVLTNIEIINDHFPKNRMIINNLEKWFNYRYGMMLGRSILMMPWKVVSSFYGGHFGLAYLKETFETVWKEEYSVLHSTCMHKFRTRRDVNHWLMRYWQLASGNFSPISPKGNKYFTIRNDNTEMINALRKHKYQMICINDVSGTHIADFDACREGLISALEDAFPIKSAFEK